jgi:hypothetical protein
MWLLVLVKNKTKQAWQHKQKYVASLKKHQLYLLRLCSRLLPSKFLFHLIFFLSYLFALDVFPEINRVVSLALCTCVL